MVLPQGGMRRSRADQAARQQTAPWRRSDQTSRWMFGRRVAEAIGPGIVSLKRDGVGHDRERMRDACRNAGETYGPAGRHEDALVAIKRHRRLRRTARHIARHLVHRGHWRHWRHLIRHRLHRRSVGRGLRHHRPGHRSQYKAGDHQDREQSAYGRASVHRSKFSQMGGDGKLIISAYHEFHRPLLIGIKLPNAPQAQVIGRIDRSRPLAPLSFPADRPCYRL